MQIFIAGMALIIYFAVLAYVGIYTKKWVLDASDYMLAGREFGFAANVIELSAIALAGSLMTFLPSLVIQYGLRTALVRYVLVLGVGYALYGLLFGVMGRDCGAQTIAEYLEIRFDYKVRTLVSVVSAFAMLGITANNVIAITRVLNRMTGLPQIFFASICFLFIIFFSVMGGFWGITLTDILQLAIGIAAVFAMLVFLFSHYGGYSFLVSHFPSVNIWTTGTHGEQMHFFSVKYPSGITMVMNFMAFLLWGNNYYFLRSNTCRNGRVARNSYIMTGLVCIPIILTPVTLLGVYAASIYPEHFWGKRTVDGAQALSLLITNLPVSLKILVMIGFLAVTISTASTALIGVTSTVSRDVLKRRFIPDMDKKQELKIQKMLMFIIALLGWALCFYSGGYIDLFGFITSWLGPAAVLVLMGAIFPWFTNKGAFWGAVAGVVLLTLSGVLTMVGIHLRMTHIHSSILGMTSTLAVSLVVSVFTKPNYYGNVHWRRVPNGENREEVILSSFDRSVLQLIRYGEVTMAEITDYIGCDSRMTKLALETLDRGGFIMRKGVVLGRFYSFCITDSGLERLKPLSEEDEKLAAEACISRLQYELLDKASISKEAVQEYMREKDFGSLKTAALISVLDHRGYVEQKGFLKRYLRVTDAGLDILSRF